LKEGGRAAYVRRMVEQEDVREAAAALIRKRRGRARELWHRLQSDGCESLAELLQTIDGLNVVTTWAGRIGGRCKPSPGDENVTVDDLVPSRKAATTMIQNLTPEDSQPLEIDRYQEFLEGEAQEEAIMALRKSGPPGPRPKSSEVKNLKLPSVPSRFKHLVQPDPQMHREPPTSGLLCVPDLLS
jgi:hypothetical protein